jgi:indolepyruvate ferredoxin oxidoreductase beta subunit
MNYDIFMVGVGGQGVITIGELIAETAFRRGIPVNFYPTEGMAQRGGFVKAQLRIGREIIGPNIPEKGADLVISMEISETLKAIRYLKPGSTCVLWGHIWAPTAVMLGKAPYPSLEQVKQQVEQAGAKFVHVDPGLLPTYKSEPVAENLFTLGAAIANSSLTQIISLEDLIMVVKEKWPKAFDKNKQALQAGAEIALEVE